MFHWLLALFLLVLPFLVLRALLPRPSSGKVWTYSQLYILKIWMGNVIPAFAKVRTTLVLGSGGHTAELLGLVGASCSNCKLASLPFLLCCWNTYRHIYSPFQIRTLDPLVYNPRTYYLADTDKLSEQKAKVVFAHSVQKFEQFLIEVLEENLGTGEYSMVRVPRAREVKFFFTWHCCTSIHVTLRGTWIFCLDR